MLCHGQTQMVLLPYHFFRLEALRSNIRNITTILGFFLEFEPKLLQQLWRETLSFLCFKVYWMALKFELS